MKKHYPDPATLEAALLNSIMPIGDQSVLEIGTGDGRMTELLRVGAATIVGVDPDLTELQAGKAVQALRRAQAKAEWLPFGSNTFDVAIFSWSL